VSGDQHELRPLGGWRLREDYAQRVQEARLHLTRRGFGGPTVALVLGSGLGNVVDRMEVEVECAFGDIPGFHAPTVQAHSGRLVQARHEGTRALVLQGRLHAYEGLPMEDVVFPIATLLALGCRTLVLTNAAGGLHPDMRPGDLMAITGLVDLHLVDAGRGLLLPPADSPAAVEVQLRGATAKNLFDRALALRLVDLGAREGIGIRTGTYVSLWGPNYEPPAEIAQLRRLGIDAVGMSTGPEAVFAHRLGARVTGVSCITNVSVEVGQAVVTHDEVIEVGAARREDMARLMLAAIAPLSETSG
jgi:purine-nucleoside phosphorylase